MDDATQLAMSVVRNWYESRAAAVVHASVFPGFVASENPSPPAALIITRSDDMQVRSDLFVALCGAFGAECEVIALVEDAPLSYRSSPWLTDIGRSAVHVAGAPIDTFLPDLA